MPNAWTIIVAFLLVQSPGIAEVIRVPDEFDTIQEAISAAPDYSTIVVAPGTYKERLIFQGKAVILRAESGPEETVLDGCQGGSVVRFDQGEDGQTVMEGFFITNGLANSGGGIHCYLSSPTVRNCVIADNHAVYDGGGVWCSNSSLSLIGNRIEENLAEWNGGGIHCYNSALLISQNRISNNRVTETYSMGGGIHCSTASPDILSNVISNNVAQGEYSYGGGIYLDSASPRILNNIVIGNEVRNNGGGIACDSGSCPIVSGNTISNNRSHWYGGGVYCFRSSPKITNNHLSGNVADGAYSCHGGGIYCQDSTLMIIENVLTGNAADKGGDLYCSRSSPFIAGNLVTGGRIRIAPEGRTENNDQLKTVLKTNTLLGDLQSSVTIGPGCVLKNEPGMVFVGTIPGLIFNLGAFPPLTDRAENPSGR